MTSLYRSPKTFGAALALSLGLALGGCGGIASNASLESLHQPVVERVNYTLDVTAGPSGLSYPEQSRVAGWFEAMDLRYGDRISIDDPMQSEATRAAIMQLAGRYGLIVSNDTPTTGGIAAGNARIIVTRAKASVPGCPDWSAKNDFNPLNATSSNYGCATNANLAAMVANPEHLLKGESTNSDTLVMSSNKAIGAYRSQAPTGTGGLKQNSTKGE